MPELSDSSLQDSGLSAAPPRKFIRRHRYALTFLLLGVMVIAAGAFLVLDLRRVQKESQRMYEGAVHGLDLIGELQYQTQEARRSILYALSTSDSNLQVSYADQSRAADAEVAVKLKQHRAAARLPEQIRAIEKLNEDWNRYLKVRDELIASMLEGSGREAVNRDLREGVPAFNQVADDLQVLKAHFKMEAEQQLAEVRGLFNRSLLKLVLIFGLTLVFAFGTLKMTQKAELLAAVQTSEARKSAILQSSLDAVITMDHAGRVLEFNPAAEKMFGYPSAEALGQSLADLIIPPALREAHQRGMKRYLATGQASMIGRQVEMTAQRKDGTEFLVDVGVVRIPGEGPPLFTGFIRDLSERKKAEAELERVHRQLVDASRQAGMAEVATGVLHNVGNVLNSVNVSATLIADKIKKSKVDGVAKAAALLNQNQANLAGFISNDPKGRQVPAYLLNLAQHLGEEQSWLVQEMETLRKNIDHVKDIVAMQQSYAKVSGVLDSLSPISLVEDALRINDAALARHHVHVVLEYAEVPDVLVDRHKALQILVNLLHNAKHALQEMDRPDKQLVVAVAGNGADRVRIIVRDNGIGIPPENLTRIFAHGFTTKKEGHGFGLHSSALAAKEMGGSLNAHSDGPYRGATFTLELPACPPKQLAA